MDLFGLIQEHSKISGRMNIFMSQTGEKINLLEQAIAAMSMSLTTSVTSALALAAADCLENGKSHRKECSDSMTEPEPKGSDITVDVDEAPGSQLASKGPLHRGDPDEAPGSQLPFTGPLHCGDPHKAPDSQLQPEGPLHRWDPDEAPSLQLPCRYEVPCLQTLRFAGYTTDECSPAAPIEEHQIVIKSLQSPTKSHR
eukprot:gnl/TRDRNA2_/TRDRNA2_66442_c0_seq1.p1 gnl/TRDRNA2_/TRDRNA2_66442_c0~~gnl/TRDRNA2_/TRDRNA2_66442_c0_seq1.p1  ORF type:complete len:217 (+),score=36.57 gnl/TRDRNA2_/TRDRNA2_66442_c0_seq1:60-653(+)